jgi:raffinose/stachyose/melibiose transport system permease protein
VKPDHRLTPYLFILPALALFVFAVVGPMVATAGFSLFDYSGYGEMVFVGLGNYARALQDDLYRLTYQHTLIYIVLTIVLEVAVGLILAGLITAVRRGRAVLRVAFFVPVMLPMVVIAVLWSYVYNPDFGVVNSTLGQLGLESWQHIWLGDERLALIAVSVVSGWVYCGFYMAIFYAAFQRIPNEVLEAARLDGAGEFTLFWRVRVPMIRSFLEVALLLVVTGGFQSFDLFYVLTNGGPYNSTEVVTTYLVKVVFNDQEVGYGSALAVLMTIVVGAVGLLYTRVRRRSLDGLEY